MQLRKVRSALKNNLTAVAVALMLSAGAWAAGPPKVLTAFDGRPFPNGLAPESNLIFDAKGNLYGTTYAGGSGCVFGCGTVFELKHHTDGSFSEIVLHRFDAGDGQNPDEAPVIFDAAGNLYGTAREGGTSGSGVVYELSPNSDGSWTETVLHNFSGLDGAELRGGLVFDAKGNLYGTASGGGTGTGCVGGNGCGVVFRLTHRSRGWSESVLHNFTNNHRDGFSPQGSLVFDARGNLYGATFLGGTSSQGGGTVFKLAPGSHGLWKETVLYSFKSDRDGASPYSGVVFDEKGNLYGTTVGGGDQIGSGTVFRLTPKIGGWTESVIHRFVGFADPGGSYPYGGLLVDAAGNLYGTAASGGGNGGSNCEFGCGTVYKLSPAQGGTWKETTLAAFEDGNNGGYPLAGLVSDKRGNLYGSASALGSGSAGVVFEVKH
jgi:uncharacterized repeat protein (TIGR03803 family)